MNNNDKRNDLCQLQMRMAQNLLKLCTENKLEIWAGYGTLLGCVRHKGFIPWDDDMDFVMMRDSFEKLRCHAHDSQILPDPYYFDITRYDVIKVRCKKTTQIQTHSSLSSKLNHNVWIDVFCLDSIPDNEKEFCKAYKRIRQLLRIEANSEQMCFANLKGIKSKIWHLCCIIYMLLHSPNNIHKEIDGILNNSKVNNCSKVANIRLYSRVGKYDSLSKLKKYERVWFAGTEFLPFENINLPCPQNFVEVLKAEYGNYMIPIKNGSLHGSTMVDLKKSYEDVVREELNKKPWYVRFFYMH